MRAAGPGAMAALGGDGLRLLSVSRPERQPESAALGGPGPGLCCWVSVFSCLSLACSYVGSLYVWKSELPRCGVCARGRNPRLREAGLWAGLGDPGAGPPCPEEAVGPLNLTALSVGTTLQSSRGASPVYWWCPASPLFACYSGENSQASRCEGGGAEGKRGRISGVLRGESKTDASFPVAQPGTSLLTLMGFRLEGIFPAALLPLLLTMVSAHFIFPFTSMMFLFVCVCPIF